MALVVYVLDNEAEFTLDVGISTDVLVQLFENSISLRQVHSCLCENKLVSFVRHSLKLAFCVAMEHNIEVKAFLGVVPLRNQQNEVLSRLQIQTNMNTLRVLVLSIDPSIVFRTFLHDNQHPDPDVLVIRVVVLLIFLVQAYHTISVFFNAKKSE